MGGNNRISKAQRQRIKHNSHKFSSLIKSTQNIVSSQIELRVKMLTPVGCFAVLCCLCVVQLAGGRTNLTLKYHLNYLV
jgi:hypothetical protein